LNGEVPAVRDHALAGVWGREVHLVTAGGKKYARAPSGENEPLSMWSNRWSTMPLYSYPDLRLPLPDDRAVLDRMPGSAVPVIRQPYRARDFLPYWARGDFSGDHLYDLDEDPGETRNLAGVDERAEKDAADRLREALGDVDAPDDQFERLGLR
jgi:hypothetical protein